MASPWRRRIRSGSKDAINERTWGLNLECGHLVFRPSEYTLPPDLMTDCEVCAAMANREHVPAPPMTLGNSTGLVYCKACGSLLDSDRKGRTARADRPCVPVPVVLRDNEPPECNCESMGGRFGAHRPECLWQVAFEEELAAEKQRAREMAEAAVYDTLMEGRDWEGGEDADAFDLARRIVHDLIESGIRLDTEVWTEKPGGGDDR